MKIRTCFVSNSSSSSCVCDVCGRTETGWDLYAGPDADMFECENGHTVCSSEAVSSFKQWLKEIPMEDEEDSFEESDKWHEVPEKMCPICSMLTFSNQDLKAYLKKKTDITEKEVFDTVKAANKRRKKLYDSEYVMYVLTKTGLRMDDLVREIKEKFQTYKEFIRACK